MTNSNQSNTSEHPATLLNSSGSLDQTAGTPADKAASQSEELSIDDLDLATLERLTAPDGPEPAKIEPAEGAPAEGAPETEASAALEPSADAVTGESAAQVAPESGAPVSVTMDFDDEPRIQFKSEEESSADLGVKSADGDEAEPSVMADTSYSADDPAAAINAAPVLTSEPAETPVRRERLPDSAPVPTPASEPEGASQVAPSAESELESEPEQEPEPEPESETKLAPTPESAPAPELTPAPLAPAVSPNAKIMGGATVMQAGHTAIMGLGERHIIPHKSVDLGQMSAADRAEIERIKALNSRRKRTPDPEPQAASSAVTGHAAAASEPAALAVESAPTVDPKTKIMGGATVMQAGHTAIMGLGERHIIPHKAVDLGQMSAAEMDAIERIKALNSRRKRTPDPESQAASEPAALAVESAPTLDPNTKIMGGATIMQAGHTAIMGLENRRVIAPQGKTSTLITGLSEEDLAIRERINAQNARNRSIRAQAETKFRAEIAAERAQAQEGGSAPGYITPHSHAQDLASAPSLDELPQEPLDGTSTFIYGSGASAYNQNNNAAAATSTTVSTDVGAEVSGASLARDRLRQALASDQDQVYRDHQSGAEVGAAEAGATEVGATAELSSYDAQEIAAELAEGVAGPVDQETVAAVAPDLASKVAAAPERPELLDTPAGGSFSAESTDDYGLSGNLGSALDDEAVPNNLAPGVLAGTEPDDVMPGSNLGFSSNDDDFAGIVVPVDNLPERAARKAAAASKVASPLVPESAAPAIGIIENVADTKSFTADQSPDLDTKVVIDGGNYYDPSAQQQEVKVPLVGDYRSLADSAPASSAYPTQAAYPSAPDFGAYGPEGYGSGHTFYQQDDTSGFDGVVAPDYQDPRAQEPRALASGEEESPYIAPGVHPKAEPAAPDLDYQPGYAVGPQVTSQDLAQQAGEPNYAVGPQVSSQDLALQAGEPNYVVGVASATAQPAPAADPAAPDDAPLYAGTYAEKLAREKIMRAKAAAAVAVKRTPELDQIVAEGMPPRAPAAPTRSSEVPNVDFAAGEGYEDDLRDQKAFAARLAALREAEGRAPAGMGDGVLSSFESEDTVSSELTDGPRYVIGPKRGPSAPSPELTPEDDSAPLYAVGVGTTNAEVEKHLQEVRGRLGAQSNLPPSYLDQPQALGQDDEYQQELTAAARDSVATPQGEAGKKGFAPAAGEHPDYGSAKLAEGYGEDAYAAHYAPDEERQTAELAPERSSQSAAVGPQSPELEAMPHTEHVKLSLALFLFLRQLIASLFTHTTLPIVAPHLALRLGPCYPSSMALPFLLVGLLVGALGAAIKEYSPLQMLGTTVCLVYVLLTGLSPYRGIYRIFAFITRRRHDAVMMAASVVVSLLVFIGLSGTLIQICSGLGEITLAFALASMLSAATASTLMWNFPQDPMDSCGTMSNKGLFFVIVICGCITFGFLHYIVALSILGVGIVMRLIFGYCIAKNQGTAQRPYVSALQLMTLLAILLDLILLKSQNYEFLNYQTLNLLEQYAERLVGLA